MGPHDGHRQRLKTEFLARPDSFPDHKLLELLFFYANPRSDTNPLAHELIDRFGSLAGVLDAPPEELCKVKGMGEAWGGAAQDSERAVRSLPHCPHPGRRHRPEQPGLLPAPAALFLRGPERAALPAVHGRQAQGAGHPTAG